MVDKINSKLQSKSAFSFAKGISFLFLVVTALSSGFSGNGFISEAHAQGNSIVIAPKPQSSPVEQKSGALVFQGEATAYGDAEAIVSILEDHQVNYTVVNSDELDAMSLDQISK